MTARRRLELLAAVLLSVALTSMVASQNWRVLTADETVILDKGMSINTRAGDMVRGQCVPAAQDLQMRTLDATPCAFLWRDSFEGAGQ